MLVKICGLTSFEDAKKAIDAQADFIGLVLDSFSIRAVEEKNAYSLIQKLKEYPVHVVGFFLEKDLSVIAQKANELELEWVQIIAPKNSADLRPLKRFRKLLVLPVNADGSYEPLTYSINEEDYLSYDFKSPGSGQSFDWAAFKRFENHPFFLAGGLNSVNVKEAIGKVKPDGVDVSSGVCSSNKRKKDANKIKEFIENAK